MCSRLVLTSALVTTLVVPGCLGEARLDTSSQASIDSSIKAMQSGLSDKDKQQLNADMSAVTMQAVFKAMSESKGQNKGPTGPELYKPLSGMTAKQIHEKAEEVRKSQAAPKS